MSVPDEDIVCRFVRSKDWSESEQRPRPGTFKQIDLSVWHQANLQSHAVRLEDLQFGSLARSGQAHYIVGDFSRIARKVKAEAARRGESGRLDVTAEWSPETVPEEWEQWVTAHVEIRTKMDCKKLWAAFRRALCTSARKVIPPLMEVDC